jgi:hypothetical protein
MCACGTVSVHVHTHARLTALTTAPTGASDQVDSSARATGGILGRARCKCVLCAIACLTWCDLLPAATDADDDKLDAAELFAAGRYVCRRWCVRARAVTRPVPPPSFTQPAALKKLAAETQGAKVLFNTALVSV